MTDKKERLFVIMEVKDEGNATDSLGRRKYRLPNENKPMWEYLHLKPSRIIPEGRLRYGRPKRGEMFFSDGKKKLMKAKYDLGCGNRLILDPEPEEMDFGEYGGVCKEKDEWDEWVDKMPSIPHGTSGSLRDWLKRMPRRG